MTPGNDSRSSASCVGIGRSNDRSHQAIARLAARAERPSRKSIGHVPVNGRPATIRS